jgi:hypothetical protein
VGGNSKDRSKERRGEENIVSCVLEQGTGMIERAGEGGKSLHKLMVITEVTTARRKTVAG